MKHEISTVGPYRLIKILENIDKGNSPAFDLLLEQQLGTGHTRFIVDLTMVVFIDSSGIGTLVRAYQAITPKSGKVILAGCNSNIRKIFRLIGLQQFFTITDTLDQALEIAKE